MWLAPGGGNFDNELQALRSLGEKGLLGVVDAVFVGSETRYRGEVSEEQLIDCMNQVRGVLQSAGYGGVMVSTADTDPAWTPALVAAADIVMLNAHPYWEDVD